MNIVESLITNIIYIIFPLICYLFYVSYNKSFSKKTNNIFLEIALVTSTYLCIKFGNQYILLFNIPLLLSYMKERNLCSILLSLMITYYYVNLGYNPYFIIFEYILYYLIFVIFNSNKNLKKSFINIFILVNVIFQIIYNLNNINISIFSITIFAVTSYLIIRFLKKAENVASIHMSVKELENSAEIRNSLFKITHEIKNPIAVCKGYLDMFDKNNPKHVEKFIPIIKQEINRTLVIMNDFMEFSKIKLELDVMDVIMLLEEVLDSLDNLINSKEIKLNYQISDDEIFINGDYNRLKQVFVNIIKNSVEALENTKNATIEVKYELKNNKIDIIVIDNGEGMDEETLNKIYEAFYTTKKYGTGLGVNLSKEIIEGHKGNIEYKSRKNKGTIVKITLPIINL